MWEGSQPGVYLSNRVSEAKPVSDSNLSQNRWDSLESDERALNSGAYCSIFAANGLFDLAELNDLRTCKHHKTILR